ncbi:MAG: GNAT family N-acetyltransferase [Gemmatimonadaceae bacterium]
MSADKPSDVLIRHATPADAAAIADLLGQLGYPSSEADVWTRLNVLAGETDSFVLTAECEGAVPAAGACHVMRVLHDSDPVAFITAFVVTGAMRRKGVGRTLIHALESEAVARGCHRIMLTSAERRTDAHAFYESVGYSHTGRRFTRQLRESVTLPGSSAVVAP